MSKRIKPKTFDTVEAYATAVSAVASYEAALRELKAQRDQALQRINQDFDVPIAAIENEMATLTTSCAQFAEGHRAELYGEAQSVSTSAARHGFRKGPPKLETLAKWTWPKVLAKLEAFHLNDYIRRKPEVNKEAILTDGKSGFLAIEENGAKIEFPMATFGVAITQHEEYFIEPKSDAAATIKAQEAAAR